MGHKYKLLYFNARGRAELARLMFAQAGVEYTDERFDKEQWLEVKPKMPGGQVPALEVDGVVFGQSHAINRFLAQEFGLAGKTALDRLRADVLYETMNDCMVSLYTAHFEKDETKKAEMMKTIVETTVPAFLERLTKELGDKKFFLGDEISYVDLQLINIEGYLKKLGNVFDKYEKLKQLVERVSTLSNIEKWLKERPVTEM